MTPNWFATIALAAWPLVAIVLYRTKPFPEATLWTVLGGLLLLPAGASIKIEMIPAFDKNSIPSLCTLIGCIALAPRRQIKAKFGAVEILAIMCVVGPVFTSLSNNDAIIIGERILPGVGYYDGISALLSQVLFFLPFFVGRRFLQRPANTETVLQVLLTAGIFYSLLMLFEIRMSPVFSSWIYGFFPSGFSSEMRYGGFRPVVFMSNGLAAAFFLATAFLAAAAFWRVRVSIRSLPGGAVTAYLGVVLILCKSAGALIYAVCVGIFIQWFSPKAQMRLAVVLVSVALLYPVLRLTGNFPSNALVDTAMAVNKERAESLKTRFDQEQQLLERASQRFLFGWGRYGRNRVYEEQYGKDISITDGAWIEVIGQFGIVGFFAQFGLLALPVFRLFSALKSVASEREKVFLGALALIVALNLVEQIPNSSMSAWNWLLAGALLGRAEYLRAMMYAPRKSPGPDGLETRSMRMAR